MPTNDPLYDGARVMWENRSVRSGRVSFGKIAYLAGGTCGPRTQRDYQLFMLESGSCNLKIGRTTRPAGVASIYLLRPGEREHFAFSGTEESMHIWCSAIPQFFPDEVRGELDAVGSAGFPCTESFLRIFSISFLASSSGPRVIEALATALFAEFLALASRVTGSPGHREITKAIGYMELHFRDPDCLEMARRRSGCSTNAFIYKFREQEGLTPARFLWRMRLEKGLALLGETGLSVGEVANRCGFKNPFHFSRMVRDATGTSPRARRQRQWM